MRVVRICNYKSDERRFEEIRRNPDPGSGCGESLGTLSDLLQISDEALALLSPPFRVGHAEEEAGMDGHPAFAAVGERLRLSAQLGDGDDLAEQRPRRRRTERHRQRRVDQLALMV